MPHYFDTAHREEIDTRRQRLTARTEWPTWLLLIGLYGGWFSIVLASDRLGLWLSTVGSRHVVDAIRQFNSTLQLN